MILRVPFRQAAGRDRAFPLDQILGFRDVIGLALTHAHGIMHAAETRTGTSLVTAADAVLVDIRTALGLIVGQQVICRLLLDNGNVLQCASRSGGQQDVRFGPLCQWQEKAGRRER